MRYSLAPELGLLVPQHELQDIERKVGGDEEQRQHVEQRLLEPQHGKVVGHEQEENLDKVAHDEEEAEGDEERAGVDRAEEHDEERNVREHVGEAEHDGLQLALGETLHEQQRMERHDDAEHPHLRDAQARVRDGIGREARDAGERYRHADILEQRLHEPERPVRAATKVLIGHAGALGDLELLDALCE